MIHCDVQTSTARLYLEYPTSHRLTHVGLFRALRRPGFFRSTRLGSEVTQPARRRAGLRAGSCTSRALARANVMDSACPVMPPPDTNAKTLYLSMRCVIFKAHNALSLSWIRGKACIMLCPLTRTSPVPSTRYTLAEDSFLLPIPTDRPCSSMVPGLAFCISSDPGRLNRDRICRTSFGQIRGCILFSRVKRSSTFEYFEAATFSPVELRYWPSLSHAGRGIWSVGAVGSAACFFTSDCSIKTWSLKTGDAVK